MYACQVSTISSTGCQLTTPFGIHFDLRNLPSSNVSTSDGNYLYFLKPCQETGLGTQCARSEDTARKLRVIQIDSSSSVCRSLGAGDGSLRYADNTLSLSYSYGDPCSSGLTRNSIITFTCPDDVKQPCSSGNCVSFVFEKHCNYEFEWVTSLACASSNAKTPCEFQLNKLNYDLGRLTEGTSPTYAALSYRNDTECYLINPCGQLVGTNEPHTAAEYCNLRVVPKSCFNNSVCKISKLGPATGFGNFDIQKSDTIKSYDKNVFSVNSLASTTGKSAVIRYVCETGRLQSHPSFISSITQNVSEFHWPTYAACPQVSQVGSGCVVEEKSTGFLFNLTSLSGTTYQFNDTHYSYKFRVCDSLPSNVCNGAASSAMCQQSLGGTNPFSCGNANSTLIYADSSLKLVYRGGKPCKNDNRTTTITFICDPNAHKATVENITEVRHCEYLIEMRSKLACPPLYRATECLLFTPSGSTFDLTELSRLTGNWQAEGPDGSVYIINVCRPLNLEGVGGCNPLSSACRVTSSVAKANIDLGYASSATMELATSDQQELVLKYNYTNPNADSDNGLCAVIHTDIRFTCNPSAPTDVSQYMHKYMYMHTCENVHVY